VGGAAEEEGVRRGGSCGDGSGRRGGLVGLEEIGMRWDRMWVKVMIRKSFDRASVIAAGLQLCFCEPLVQYNSTVVMVERFRLPPVTLGYYSSCSGPF
jgi:hypothetical protein